MQAGEATYEKVTYLKENDVSISNIFPRINYDCYKSVERRAVMLEIHVCIGQSSYVSVSGIYFSTSTEATQTLLTWELW